MKAIDLYVLVPAPEAARAARAGAAAARRVASLLAEGGAAPANMSAPLGPRGRPVATPAASQPPPQPEMPDLSHLTEEERKIILAVMDRQKKEEEKEQSVLK